MRSKITLFHVVVVIIMLGFISVGFAYDVQVEIIPLGDYPVTALPPGESFGNIYRTDNWTSYTYEASLEAKANPGWIFVGWEFDESFFAKHQKPNVFEILIPLEALHRGISQRPKLPIDLQAVSQFVQSDLDLPSTVAQGSEHEGQM